MPIIKDPDLQTEFEELLSRNNEYFIDNVYEYSSACVSMEIRDKDPIPEFDILQNGYLLAFLAEGKKVYFVHDGHTGWVFIATSREEASKYIRDCLLPEPIYPKRDI